MIDLDAHPADPDGRSRPPGLRPGLPRLLVVLAVGLVTLAGLGASGAPAPGLTLVLSAGGTAAAAFTLGGETLYTASFGVSNSTSSEFVRPPLGPSAYVFGAPGRRAAAGGAVPGGPAGRRRAAGPLRHRPADHRARRPDRCGAVGQRVRRGSVVTVAHRVCSMTADVPGGTEVRLAEPRTGRTVWTRTVDTRVYFGPDNLWSGDPARIVAIGGSGAVVTLDFATGAALSRGELGGPLQAGGLTAPDGVLASTVGGNRLLINRRSQGRTSLTAYSLVPFAQLWQRTDAPVGTVGDCGAIWCLTWLREGVGRNGYLGGVTAIYLADGATLWSDENLTYAARFGERRVIGFSGGESADLLQLDPATGVGPTTSD